MLFHVLYLPPFNWRKINWFCLFLNATSSNIIMIFNKVHNFISKLYMKMEMSYSINPKVWAVLFHVWQILQPLLSWSVKTQLIESIDVKNHRLKSVLHTSSWRISASAMAVIVSGVRSKRVKVSQDIAKGIHQTLILKGQLILDRNASWGMRSQS